MTGRVAIITGANSGIGFETARLLCEGGNDVVLACRNEEKGKAAVEKILNKNPNALATFMQLDLADLSSVKKFVEDFHGTGKKLHILVNNAGVYASPKDGKRQFSKDNFELTMGTNHLGHFLLASLLLEDLKKAASEENGDAKIVVVTTSLHDKAITRRRPPMEALDLDNFFLEKPGTYNAHQAYKNSKLANVMFTYELARQLEGSNLTANCVCPGFIPSTELTRHASSAQKFYRRYILHGMLRFIKATRSVEQGARAVVEMVSGEKLKDVNGKYYKDHQEQKSSEESLNEDLQKKLWELSARYCHLEGYEPLDAPSPPPPEEPAKTKDKTKTEEEGKAEEKGAGDTERTEKAAEEQPEQLAEKEKQPEDTKAAESSQEESPKQVEEAELKKDASAEVNPPQEVAAQ